MALRLEMPPPNCFPKSARKADLNQAAEVHALSCSFNRLNVAVSRAQGMANLVCRPALLDAIARTTDQMRVANAMYRLVEVTQRPYLSQAAVR